MSFAFLNRTHGKRSQHRILSAAPPWRAFDLGGGGHFQFKNPRNLGAIIHLRIAPITALASCLCLLTSDPALAQLTNTIGASTNLVDIGGRRLEMASFGLGAPTVIVESGLGDPAVESGSWKSVIDQVAKTTQICIYDRAGLGKSDAVTNTSRTTQDFVEDLHMLLVNAKVPPPYLLVGHSLGGYPVRLFASQYPGEVAGIVLVDTSIPDEWSKFLALLPPESPQEEESIRKARNLFIEMADPQSFRTLPEHLDFAASSAEVSAAGNLGNISLIVISHSHDRSSFPDLPKSVSVTIEQSWNAWQSDLCRLSSNSTNEIAVKAGHDIQRDEPQLVTDAILRIVGAAKK